MILSCGYFIPYPEFSPLSATPVPLANYTPRDVFCLFRHLELALTNLDPNTELELTFDPASGGQQGKIILHGNIEESEREYLQGIVEKQQLGATLIPLFNINKLKYPVSWLINEDTQTGGIIGYLLQNNLILHDDWSNFEVSIRRSVEYTYQNYGLYVNLFDISDENHFEDGYSTVLEKTLDIIDALYNKGIMSLTPQSALLWQCKNVDENAQLYQVQTVGIPDSEKIPFLISRLNGYPHFVFVGKNRVVRHMVSNFLFTRQSNVVYYRDYVAIELRDLLDYSTIDKVRELILTARGQVRVEELGLLDTLIAITSPRPALSLDSALARSKAQLNAKEVTYYELKIVEKRKSYLVISSKIRELSPNEV